MKFNHAFFVSMAVLAGVESFAEDKTLKKGLSIIAQDQDVKSRILAQTTTEDIVSLATTSQFWRDEVMKSGYVFKQVEISSFQQLNDEYENAKKLFDVKFHKSISRQELFKCLPDPRIDGKIDVRDVVDLSHDEKTEIEKGLIKVLSGHSHDVQLAYFSPDSKKILSVAFGENPRLWSTESSEDPILLQKTYKHVFRWWISNKGIGIHGGYQFGSLSYTVFDETGAAFDGADAASKSVQMGDYFLPSNGDVDISHSICYTGEIGSKVYPPGRVNLFFEGCVDAFSNNLARALSNSDGRIKVWDIETNEVIQKFRHSYQLGGLQVVASFSPDGKRVVTSDLKIAKIWDSETGKLLFKLPIDVEREYDYLKKAPIFSPNGKTILTIDRATIKLWNVKRAIKAKQKPSGWSSLKRSAVNLRNVFKR